MFTFNNMNEEQLEAVRTTEGYVRVVAGPGSGKTRVLTNRYVNIVKANGISPDRIMCVTFTNKAAFEMKRRIRGYLLNADVGWIGTFHGICHKILKQDIWRLNYPETFKIIDVDEQKTILREIYEKNGWNLSNAPFSEIIKEISFFKKDLKYIKRITDVCHPISTISESIIDQYLDLQQRNYYLDFDDIINFVLYLLKTNQDFLKKWASVFEYIQVDEFQDVSSRQYELVCLLSSIHNNLFIVGDPDQTIYSWRGANPKFMLNFDKNFPNVKTVKLIKNYRSSPEIINVSNSLISKNQERIQMELVPIKNSGVRVQHYHGADRKSECEWIANKIIELQNNGENLSNIAILYRTHQNSRAIEEILLSKKIPYCIIQGIAFYERKEIKDIISYLSMLLYQDDISFLRTINVPRRGIGSKRKELLMQYVKQNHCNYYYALKECIDHSLFKKTKAKEYISLIENGKNLISSLSVLDLVDYVTKESGYETSLMLDGDQQRLDNLQELKDAINEMQIVSEENISLQDYLKEVALVSNADGNDKKDSVKLMTAHASKGLEFPIVFVAHLVEGNFPSFRVRSKAEMEEERRLMYVAVTRAEKDLYLTDSEFNAATGSVFATSRFVLDVENKLIDQKGKISPEYIDWSRSYAKNIDERLNRNEKELALYEVDDIIEHPVFGIGQILKVTDYTYTIEFLDKTRTIEKIFFKTK